MVLEQEITPMLPELLVHLERALAPLRDREVRTPMTGCTKGGTMVRTAMSMVLSGGVMEVEVAMAGATIDVGTEVAVAA